MQVMDTEEPFHISLGGVVSFDLLNKVLSQAAVCRQSPGNGWASPPNALAAAHPRLVLFERGSLEKAAQPCDTPLPLPSTFGLFPQMPL